MTRPARIITGILGMTALLVVLAVIVIKVVFTKDHVLSIITPQLAKVIQRPISISDAGISIWGGMGLRLEGLTIGNREGFGPEPLAQIADIDIKVRFWPLLFGRLEVDRILVDQPQVMLSYDQDGNANYYRLFAERAAEDTTAPAEGARLSVGKLIISDAHLILRDQQVGRWADLFGADVEASLDMPVSQRFDFTATAVFDSLLFVQERRRLSIRAGNPSVYAGGQWDKASQTLRVDSSVIEWWGAGLSTRGSIRFLPSLKEISVNALLASVQVEKIIDEIESAVPVPQFTDLNALMAGNVEANFIWPLPEGNVPDWEGRFELTNVQWKLPQTGSVFTIPRVEVRGTERSVSWTAQSGRIKGGGEEATVSDGTFSTTGTIDQLFGGTDAAKTFSGQLEASLPLDGTRGLFPDEWAMTLGGELNVDLTAFGSVDDWRNLQINGRIHSDRLLVADEDWDLDSVSVALDANVLGHGLALSRCEWIAGDSRGQVQGRIDGLLPAVLNKFIVPDVPRGQLDVRCPFVNIDRLVGEEKPVYGKGGFVPSDPTKVPLLSLLGSITADTALYNGLTITDASAGYEYHDRVFKVSAMRGHALGGTASGFVAWDLNFWPQPKFGAALQADSIEANELLSRYINWAGGVSGTTSISGSFSGQGRYAPQILPTLIAQGRGNLRTGRLEVAPLLAAIGKSLGVQGLDRPRILRDIAVPFRIENGRIHTDQLRLVLEDVALSASGSFGYDHTLSYRINATAVDEAGPQALQGGGVHLRLTGTPSNPVIAIDAAGTARDALEDIREQARDTLKQTIDRVLDDLLKPRKP